MRATRHRRALAAVLALLALLLPLYAPTQWIYLCSLLAINVISTVGLNIVTGYTGLLSLGHGAFMGVGAYATGYFAIRLGLPFYLAIPLGGVVAAVLGLAFGLPSLRIRGLYLVIATLSAQFILNWVFNNWTEVTGGLNGLSLQPAAAFGVVFDSDARLYFLCAVPAIGLSLFAANLFRTRVGRAFIAIRERDRTAEVLGISLVRYKLAAFALGSFYAGIAGGLMAYFFRIVTPGQYQLDVSVFFLAAVVVGGMGSIAGSLLGAAFMTLLPEVLRLLLDVVGQFFALRAALILVPLRETVFGLLLILFLIYEPRGLIRLLRRVLDRRGAAPPPPLIASLSSKQTR